IINTQYEMANGEEVQVDGVEDRANKDLVDIDVEFENVEVGRKFENIEVGFELIRVEVINEEHEDGVDLQDDGVDLQEDGVDLQADGVDLLKDGVDLQDDGVDLQEDGVDLQHDLVELQDDGHNIQPAVAPARVRTRRQSQRLVMRNWNRRSFSYFVGLWYLAFCKVFSRVRSYLIGLWYCLAHVLVV
ncbi:hypothetical protein Tco_0161289, partial [Tanacetum coccineum]